MSFIFSVFLTDKHFHITIWLNINYSCLSFFVFLTDNHFHITIWLNNNNYSHLSFFQLNSFFRFHFFNSTCLIKPNFCFDLSHWRSTTVSLETRISFFLSSSLTSTFTLLFDSILIIIYVFHFFVFLAVINALWHLVFNLMRLHFSVFLTEILFHIAIQLSITSFFHLRHWRALSHNYLTQYHLIFSVFLTRKHFHITV